MLAASLPVAALALLPGFMVSANWDNTVVEKFACRNKIFIGSMRVEVAYIYDTTAGGLIFTRFALSSDEASVAILASSAPSLLERLTRADRDGRGF